MTREVVGESSWWQVKKYSYLFSRLNLLIFKLHLMCIQKGRIENKLIGAQTLLNETRKTR